MKTRLKTLCIKALRVLFSYAELGEDFGEDLVGGDFAGDGAEVVNGKADILA